MEKDVGPLVVVALENDFWDVFLGFNVNKDGFSPETGFK